MKYLLAWIAVFSISISGQVVADEPDIAPVIPPDAVIEVVSTGNYRFVEGTALAPDGSIYFSDIPNSSIHRYDPSTGETMLFTAASENSNGLAFYAVNLIQCRHGGRDVFIQPTLPGEPADTHAGRSVATSYDALKLNSPNDVVIAESDLYFTDPRYGNRDSMEMTTEGVYFLAGLDDKPAELIRVIDDLVRPNGIGISPDGQTLYVNDNGDKKIWAYPILEPGKLGEARLLNDLADLGGPDGMTVGPLGRIYTTIYGQGVLILSPDGERLGFLETGPQTTNCVFGADGRTLYVTAEKSLKRIVLNTGVDAHH
ncbi:MAG: SMP-30/gluconolactonase/LRE family protein [Planctomycetota bacterium]